MANLVKIEGVNAIIKNLRKQKGIKGKNVLRGMKKAGLFLQRESQKIVPVDTGALKNSAFTRTVKGKAERNTKGQFVGNNVVVVGYTQLYAIYVHEDLNATHQPGKEAKFLEKPAKMFARQMGMIIAKEAKRRR